MCAAGQRGKALLSALQYSSPSSIFGAETVSPITSIVREDRNRKRPVRRRVGADATTFSIVVYTAGGKRGAVRLRGAGGGGLARPRIQYGRSNDNAHRTITRQGRRDGSIRTVPFARCDRLVAHTISLGERRLDGRDEEEKKGWWRSCDGGTSSFHESRCVRELHSRAN